MIKCKTRICIILMSLNVLLAVDVQKDICKRCLQIEKCPLYRNMNRQQQDEWVQKFPCDQPGQNDTTTLYGFAAVAKGDYVCCPDSQVWGVESDDKSTAAQNDNTSSNIETSTLQGNTDIPGDNVNLTAMNNRFGYYPNNRYPHYQNPYNQDGYGNQNYNRPNNRYPNQNMYGNQPNQNYQYPNRRVPSNHYGNQNQLGDPRRQNTYGNPQNIQGDPRGHNTYGNQQNIQGDPRGQNTYRNQQNMQGDPRGQNTYDNQHNLQNDHRRQNPYGNQQNPDVPPYQGANYNNPGERGSQSPGYQNYPGNNYQGNPSLNNPTPGQNQNPYFMVRPNQNYPQQQNSYQNNNPNGNGNSYGANLDGQCPAQSFPPDPQTGCCGRDDSDADKITDLQSLLNRYAPAHHHNWPQQNQQNYPVQDKGASSGSPNYSQRRKREADNSTVEITLDDRIAGGKETELDQFPWTVLLKTTFDYGDHQAAFSCGGSLISPRYVLTASHCVYEEGAKISDIEVTLAEYDKRTSPKDCKMVVGVGKECIDNVIMHAEDVIHHPKYDDTKLHNDIALIRLHGFAPYTRYIRSVCLPPVDIDDEDFSNLPLAVAGWGRNGPYVSDVKQSTVVHLVTHKECEKSYPHLSQSHLCAAGRTGEDTCKGDSGGPLMMLYQARYYVIGIVSGKRADSPCGTSVPSLYTNVNHYMQWIKDTIKN